MAARRIIEKERSMPSQCTRFRALRLDVFNSRGTYCLSNLLFFAFRFLRLLVRRARAGRSKEQLAPVRKGHIPRVRPFFRMIARLITVYHHLGPFGKRVL